jgi:hypothetical protein
MFHLASVSPLETPLPSSICHSCSTSFVPGDVSDASTTIVDAHGAYVGRQEALDILHRTIPVEIVQLQRAVEHGPKLWTHPSKPVNVIRDFRPSSHCIMAKMQRLSHKGGIHKGPLGSHFQFDVRGPMEVPSIHGNVYEVGAVELTSGYLWKVFQRTKVVDEFVRTWLSEVIPKLRALHSIKLFTFQSWSWQLNCILTYGCTLLNAQMCVAT